jgi:hypothetical protein
MNNTEIIKMFNPWKNSNLVFPHFYLKVKIAGRKWSPQNDTKRDN